jgi:uncharacterized protein YabE (DUF348 family)
MKRYYWLVSLSLFFLFACQPATFPVTVIDNDQIIILQTNERVLSTLLVQAGITLNPNDRVLINGLPAVSAKSMTDLLNEGLPTTNIPITNFLTLQVRRAVAITFVTPDGENRIHSSAFTVGDALQEASIGLAGGKAERDWIHPSQME